MLSHLRHPNIVKLVDVASINNLASMITEYRGVTLTKIINSQAMKEAKAAWEGAAPVPFWFWNLILQLLCGVQYVHSQNIIHADLKPTNMVIDDHGVLRLIDFGCATVDLPGHRRVQRPEDVRVRGLGYGILPYKAIELLLCDLHFWQTS